MAFDLLAEKGSLIVLQVVIFLVVIEMWSLITFGKSLSHLIPEDGEKVLARFHDSRIAIFRKGFWGVSTLAKLSVYGQPEVYPKIHYVMRELVRD